MNEILIKDLECFGYHGVLEEEKRLGQKFIVSVSLKLDFIKAIEHDLCQDTVDYGAVSQCIVGEVANTNFNLIESLADHLAKEILIRFALVEHVTVEIKKPWAPLKVHLDTVSVRVERGWHSSYIGVGSNMGDSKSIIEDAFQRITSLAYNKDVLLTNLITTKPYGYKEQNDFVNGAISLKTLLYPKELLHFLQAIELDLKRRREIHWGPRTIDLDILLYDNIVLQDEELIIPHPEMCKRDFVLKPLCELNPNIVHPLYHKRVCDLYQELQTSNTYEKTVE